MSGMSAEQGGIAAANIVGAIATGVGGSLLGQKLAKGASKTAGEVAGTVGGNVGGLALQLIVQGSTGVLTGEAFAEDIKVLIISELLEQALTKLIGGPVALVLLVVQIVGAILDSFWDPFRAIYQKDLDVMHEQYQQEMRNNLYSMGYKWPLVATPNILPVDADGKLLEPVRNQVEAHMREYLNLKGLVYASDVIRAKAIADAADYKEVSFLSDSQGTLIGSLANVDLNTSIVAAKMITLVVRYREARDTIARNARARESKRKMEIVKKFACYASCFVVIVLIFILLIRKLF